jgi:hypothetical protein
MKYPLTDFRQLSACKSMMKSDRPLTDNRLTALNAIRRRASWIAQQISISYSTLRLRDPGEPVPSFAARAGVLESRSATARRGRPDKNVPADNAGAIIARDRWKRRCPDRMSKAANGRESGGSRSAMRAMEGLDLNTSQARHVWFPIHSDGERPLIDRRSRWSLDDYA